MKKNIFYSILVILFCTSVQGAKNKYDDILNKILRGNSMDNFLKELNYNETMQVAPPETKVGDPDILAKIGDEYAIPIATYYCEVYKLLVNLVARGMHDAGVIKDDFGTVSLTTYFTPNILSAYEKITEIYVKIPVHVRHILHDIDYAIKMSETVDGYNSGYSLIDIYQIVPLLIDKNRCVCKDCENRAFCERALFENITIPTNDCCLEKFGMKSLAPLWDKAAKLRRQLGFVFNFSIFMPFLMDNILLEYPKIQENYLLFSSDMVFADPSIRLVKRIAEIKLYLEKIENVEEKNRIEAIIDGVVKKLPALQRGYRAQRYEDEKHQVHILPLVNLYNFLNTGHITLLHLSSILTKLKSRVEKLSQDSVSEAKKAYVELERCIKHISIFIKLVSKLPRKVKPVNVASSKKLTSETKEEATLTSKQIDSIYGPLIYDPILTPPSCQKDATREAMKALVESIELRQRYNAEFDANKKSVENFQIKFEKKKGPKESTFHLAVELLGYIFGDYDWRVGSGGDAYVKWQRFEGNYLTILSASLGGEKKELCKNIVHDIAVPENEKIEKTDLISDVLHLADKSDNKIFVLSDGATLSQTLVKGLGYQPGELDGYHLLLCPVVIVKSNYVEPVLAVFKKMEDLSMGSVIDVLAQLVPPAGLVMGLLYVLVPHAKVSGAKIESEASTFTVGEAGFCRYSQKGLMKYKSIKDAIDDDSQNSMQAIEPLLVEKYFKDICQLSSSEKAELSDYFRDGWRLKILFAIHESFYRDAVSQKKESDLMTPYFGDLFELYQSLKKKCGMMSQKVAELVKKFEDEEKKQTNYTISDIMNLMLAYSTDQALLTKIVGSEKQFEEFFFREGELRILKQKKEKEKNLRISLLKKSFYTKSGIERFEKGETLLAESSKFPPMRGLYSSIFLALIKHKFIRDYPRFLFGLLGEDKGRFFLKMTEPWIFQNRLFDMSHLTFIPKEKYNEGRTKMYGPSGLRTLLKSLSENSKKKSSLHGDDFLAYFYNDPDVNGQFYKVMLDMAGGSGDYYHLMDYCNFYGTCNLVSKEAPKLQDNAAEIFCKFVGQHKKKDGKKLTVPFLEGFAKQNSGNNAIIEKNIEKN